MLASPRLARAHSLGFPRRTGIGGEDVSPAGNSRPSTGTLPLPAAGRLRSFGSTVASKMLFSSVDSRSPIDHTGGSCWIFDVDVAESDALIAI
jgi:hypothetical protein